MGRILRRGDEAGSSADWIVTLAIHSNSAPVRANYLHFPQPAYNAKNCAGEPVNSQNCQPLACLYALNSATAPSATAMPASCRLVGSSRNTSAANRMVPAG